MVNFYDRKKLGFERFPGLESTRLRVLTMITNPTSILGKIMSTSKNLTYCVSNRQT